MASKARIRYRKNRASVNHFSEDSFRWLRNVRMDYLHKNCPYFSGSLTTSGFPNCHQWAFLGRFYDPFPWGKFLIHVSHGIKFKDLYWAISCNFNSQIKDHPRPNEKRMNQPRKSLTMYFWYSITGFLFTILQFSSVLLLLKSVFFK